MEHLLHHILGQHPSHCNAFGGIWFYFPIQNPSMQPVIAMDLGHLKFAVPQVLNKTPVFDSSNPDFSTFYCWHFWKHFSTKKIFD